MSSFFFFFTESILCFPLLSVICFWKKTRLIRASVGVFSIDENTLDRVGGSKDSVKLPEESGGGYMAYLEIFHLLHCVVSKFLFHSLIE